VAKECGIIDTGENVVDVTAVPQVKDTPARVFYTSPKGVSAIWLQKGPHICYSWQTL